MNNESRDIVILHGWGLKGSTYGEFQKLLEKKGFKVFSPDLPGFGTEMLVSENMKLDDYVSFVREFVRKKKLQKPIFVAHSFGGRIAIKYAWKYPSEISKIILTGVPVIRHKTFKKMVAYYLTVIGGIFFRVLPKSISQILRKVLYFAIGEWDYYNAGPKKQVFKNIVGEDLQKYASEISLPIGIIWGEMDRLTPASDLKKIAKLMPKAKIIIIKDFGHKLPYESPDKFFKAFLEVI